MVKSKVLLYFAGLLDLAILVGIMAWGFEVFANADLVVNLTVWASAFLVAVLLGILLIKEELAQEYAFSKGGVFLILLLAILILVAALMIVFPNYNLLALSVAALRRIQMGLAIIVAILLFKEMRRRPVPRRAISPSTYPSKLEYPRQF
jgi:hypothetical protein